jgi:tetratricopeptide (TPR) repeat protein
MRLQKMLRDICIGLSISLLTYASSLAQSYVQTQTFAAKAMARSDYKTALHAYQRLSFFGNQQEQSFLNYQIAYCYHQQAKFTLAASYYDKCFFLAGDSLAQQAVFGKMGVLLGQHKYNEALAEIYAVQTTMKKMDTTRLFFYEGLAHFGNKDFAEAGNAFKNALIVKDGSAALEIEELLQDDRLSKPNPELAFKLSFFLPGLGQFYAGDVKNGFNALALNSALVLLAVNIATNYTLLDAGIAIVPWFQRYYMGGTEKAKIIAQRKLTENQGEVFNEILDVFERDQKQE